MNKIKEYSCFVIIIIVGVIDLFYGVYHWYLKDSFINQAKTATGYIDMISNHKSKRLLHIHYYVNDHKYNGVIITKNKKIKISDSISIFYDVKNPKKISNGELQYLEGFIIALGILIILLGFLLIFRNYKKRN
ncbi:MAG: hypothetical protein HFJ12_07150 [Bacilli bacterium]|nr:hypothetical protein [Bacilli bacterium]